MLRVLAWLFVWFLGVLRFWDLGETILPKFEGVTPSSMEEFHQSGAVGFGLSNFLSKILCGIIFCVILIHPG